MALLRIMRSDQASSTGQESPGASVSGSDGSPQGPPPGPPPSGDTGRFSTQTLSALMGLQQQSPPSTSTIAASMIQQLDSNGDGGLSLDEIESALNVSSSSDPASGLSAAFAKLDTDGDGDLSQDELESALDAMGPGGAPPPPPSSSDVASDLMGVLDSDGNGELSLDEIQSALDGSASDGDAGAASGADASSSLAQAFDKLDANGDGEISADELSSAIDAFQQAQLGVGKNASAATGSSWTDAV